MTRRLLLAACLAVGGCAGSGPPPVHTYLLLPGPAASAVAKAAAVRLTAVDVAPYLDRNGIVLYREPAEVHVARQHVWAEPLDASIARYLQVAVGRASGRSVELPPFETADAGSTLEVRIQQLHGSMAGQVRLVAEYRIEAEGEEARLHRFESSEAQRGDGYAALVEAHAAVLDRLAADIAAAL